MRRTIFRTLIGALGIAVGLTFGVCQSARAGSLDIGLILEPEILDPTSSPSATISSVVYAQLFEGLVRIGPHWAVEPLLATSWEVSHDGMNYVFHLRPGVQFQDGEAFDAAAVKFSLERAIAPNSLNPQRALLDCIGSVDVIDPLTVAVHLSRPYSGLLRVLAYPAAVIVAPNSAATDAIRPIGTGPFEFASWQRGYQVTLKRNPHYWGVAPRLEAIGFKFIGDPNAALDAVLTGDVDVFEGFPTLEAVTRLRNNPQFTVKIGQTDAKTIMSINNRRPPFNDPRVRRALAYAIDRQAIIDAAMYGFGTPIGSHYATQDPGYVDLTGAYPYDPQKARALLAQAGYPNGFATTLTIPPLAYAERSGEIIAAELGAVGIKVKILPLNFGPWLVQVFGAHDFDLTIVSHVEPLDYDIYARPGYYFGYDNPRYNAVLQQLDAATDPAKSNVLAGQLQRILADDAVNAFLFQPDSITVISSRVHGIWAETPLTYLDLDNASIDRVGAAAAGSAVAARAIGIAISVAVGGLLVFVFIRAGLAYAARRLVSLGLTLLAASLAIFAATQLAPGDPALDILGMNASPAAVAALHAQLGLNAPFPQRYADWLLALLHGNFGTSWAYHEPVGRLIAERISLTLPLTVYALLISTALAFVLGCGAVLWRGKWLGLVFGGLARLGLAVPNFWFGLMLIVPFAIVLRWFSAGGFPGWSAGIGPALRALTLPAIALALPLAAALARILQFELLELQGQEFLRTARSKGLSRAAVLLRHALPNALVPVLTILGLQFSALLTGGILIENVFFLPGLGRLLFQAIADQDRITVQSVAIVLVAQVVLVALLSDLAAAAADPRRRNGDVK